MNKRKAPEGAITNNQIDNTTKNMVLSMLSTKPQSRFVLARAIGINERTFRAASLNYAKALDLLRIAKALRGNDPDQITIGEVMQL